MHTRNLRIRSAALVLLLMTATTSVGKPIYVDDDAPGANNGTSWIDAFRCLQDSFVDANDGDEIRVAQGIYTPDRGEGITAGDRGAIFALKGGVATRGGYAGYGSPAPNARDIKRYKTILSGDLAGNDVEVADPCDLFTEPSRSENSEHILTVGGGALVLDGFTVTSANCSYSGGGLVMSEADLVVTDCIFTANSAGYSGGAMTGWNSQVVFERCQFIGNAAAGNGGAVMMETCTCRDGYLGCVDCKFINNSAGGDGGAIHLATYPYMLTSLMNCLITGNKAAGHGAALNVYSVFSTSLVNCTLSGNWAKSEAPCPYEYGGASLINCILRYNRGSTICPATASYSYSAIDRGTRTPFGDPCFISPGYWDADGLWVDGDYHLRPTSPCIDAGDPEFISEPANPTIPGGTYITEPEKYIIRSSDRDLDGWPRVVGGRVDMGAYEYQGSKIIYVDADAAGANNGSSWADAYNYLQDTLMFAIAGDEIRVAQGVYRPDEFVLSKRPNLGREETFQLKNGVTLKGGYAGFGEPDPNARDVKRFETILSGDLNADDGPGGTNVGDNSRHVVTGSGTNDTAIIDGVTITAGYADGSDGDFPFINNGAGMYNENGSPTLINCTFTQNIVVLYDYEYGGLGAAIYNLHSHPLIKNCTFGKNSTGGGHGAVYNESSSPMISDCVFRDNDGGGMEFQYQTGATVSRCRFIGNVSGYGAGVNCEYGSSPVIRDCVFVGNTAWYDGGALRCYEGCYPAVSNCIFTGNKAVIQNGGAMLCYGSSPTVTNCTFTGNSANRGGGAILCHRGSSPKLSNCILWNNSAQNGNQIALNYFDILGLDPSATEITVSYSNVQGGPEAVFLEERCKLNWGPGNTDAHPRFVLPGFWDPNGTPENADDDFWVNGDYHLKSQAGRWDATDGRWTIDEVTSPCIDAGDPLGPIGLEPFPNGGIVNMGAYGGTAEASKSYFDKPLCEVIFAGDINGDCEVDFRDFAIMALHWLENYQP